MERFQQQGPMTPDKIQQQQQQQQQQEQQLQLQQQQMELMQKLMEKIEPPEDSEKESFVNMPNKNMLDLNLLLKSLLFACLFYILAHSDTTKMIKPVVGKLGSKNMDIVLMLLFVVCYYIINMFI